MSRHPVHIEHYQNNQDLARALGNLTYGSLEEVIGYLAAELEEQVRGDAEKGRSKLVAEMTKVVESLHDARKGLNKAWNISRPYTEEIR